MATFKQALKVACPLCHQGPDKVCVGTAGWRKGKYLSTLHNERLRAVSDKQEDFTDAMKQAGFSDSAAKQQAEFWKGMGVEGIRIGKTVLKIKK
jgi:hypothetical protein